MASVRQMVEQRIEQIENSIKELRGHVDEGDFDKLIGSADDISEQGDKLAQKLLKIAEAMGDEGESTDKTDESEDEDDEEDEEDEKEEKEEKPEKKPEKAEKVEKAETKKS